MPEVSAASSGGASPAQPRPPLRVAIATVGTRGDVQPYVALALALRRRGHSVVVATEARMEAFVRALVDNQELDSRNSTGAIYWEGLSELLDSKGQRVGRGYLEMTGYAQPLKL